MFTEKKDDVLDLMCRMLISRTGKAVGAAACMCPRCL